MKLARTASRDRWRRICWRCIAIMFIGGVTLMGGTAWAHPTTHLLRAAESFDRHDITDPSALARVRAAHNLSGGGCCVTGWFEYDVDIASTGWHKLLVHGNTGGVEFLIDADASGRTAPEMRFLGGSDQNQPVDKIGNVWMTGGIHRIRLQRYFWTGFPSITAVELQPSDDTLADAIAIAAPTGGSLFRKGECPELEIIAGGLPQAEKLRISEADPYTFVTYRQYVLQFPASETPSKQRFALPCGENGARILWFADSHGNIPNEKLRSYAYEVFDTHAPTQPSLNTPNGGLLVDIDCAEQEPDYVGGGATRVVRRSYGAYRESSDTGWTRFQRAPEIVRRTLPEPSWFAYALPKLAPQQRYRIDVAYPDDAWRTFGMAMRESSPLSYSVAVGVDTGGEFRLSDSMQTMSMTVWPRGVSPRLTFMTAHNGSRAACSRIRIYRTGAPEPVSIGNRQGFRRFINWQEEGANFANLFGPVDESPRGQRQAVERWAEAAKAIGANTLLPTVAIYSFTLYPSRFNLAFSNQREDSVRQILLAAERYELGVVPELHPRADELAWGRADRDPLPDNLLLDKNGRSNFYAANGKTRNFPPYFNPLSPKNQDWYVAMIGELADRYRDSPAFEGISLRVMQWANPALNNLVNLDWGYDDATVTLFKRETGSAVPYGNAADPNRFAIRHAWLTNVGRQEWINWRCRKIADLIHRIRDRVREARPDLNVYLNIVGGGEEFASGASGSAEAIVASRLREAGIDSQLLGAIDGVVLLNATYRYGRREADALQHGYRDTLVSRAAIHAFTNGNEPGQFISTQNYLEATDTVIPPERLGFPAGTKRTWASIVANPPGRLALERYAIQLAEADALTLGDGGNGYSFGPPVVREFMENFRRLPARPFTSRADAIDPVAVRSLVEGNKYYFYAVNRQPYPLSVDIRLSKTNWYTRLAAGSPQPVRDNRIRIELPPYELVAMEANATARIEAVSVVVPDDERALLERQIAAVDTLASLSPLQVLLHGGLSETERKLLTDTVRAARTALARGWLWQAHAVLEHSSLLAIYKKTGCFPPAFSDGDREGPHCGN